MEAIPHMIRSSALLALLLVASGGHAAPTQLAASPLSGASSVEISPNILFVLDDSGSMDWDYLPDWAGLSTQLNQTHNPRFNGIAYNPAVTYSPPKYFQADGTPDTTTYPSQITWTAVKDDGYGVQSTGTNNLVGNAYYFTTVAGEYCTNRSLKTCKALSAPSVDYPIPAYLRWCKTAADAVAPTPADGACQATEVDPSPPPPDTPANIPFNFPRMPAPRASIIAISGSSSTSISSITVDAREILSAAIAASSSPTTLASAIEASINACTYGLAGNCTIVGYNAVATGSTVLISAPGITDLAPVIIKSGSMSIAASSFARPATNLAPGENLLTVITPTTTTYPKAVTRSDCAASECTHSEEMTNYANWWAYYRTRMQAMKTATSLSFEPIGSSFRVGYMTINNNTTTDFQNIDSFNAAQKKAWYDKLFTAYPKDGALTPLRVALSNAGRLYAGRLNELTFNGVKVVDPVQHYCQQNVTILSTDGYWNEGAGFKWNGVTAVGDQDGPGLEVRPQLDGGSPQLQMTTTQIVKTETPTLPTLRQKKTEKEQSQKALLEISTFTQMQTRTSQLQSQDPQWQSRTSQLQISTFTQQQSQTLSQLQVQTSTLQKRSGPLRGRTANLQTRTKTQDKESTSQLQSQAAQLQSKTYQLQQKLIQVQKKTSSNGGTTWTGWSDVATCSPVNSGANRVQCQTLAPSIWNSVSSCTKVDGGETGTGGEYDPKIYTTDSQCQYTSPSWVNTGACTAVAQSPGPTNYTVGVAVECQTTWPNPWVDASSCTTSPTMKCQYTAWTGYSNVDSCTPQAQSSGSPYTVGVATQCTTGSWTPWADTTATCIVSTKVGCQYGGWSNYAIDPTCEDVGKSTASPYTVTTAKQCAVNYGNWSNVASNSTCSVVDSGATQTQCQYTNWTGWSNTGACTAVPQSTSSPYSVTTAKNCQTLWTTFTNVPNCVPDQNTQCQTVWTAFANTSSCTKSDTTDCQYTPWTGYSNVASCTPLAQSTGTIFTVGTARECQLTWPNPWVDASSCTASDTKKCQYEAWSGWSNTGACSEVAQANDYSVSLARECQTDWTPWTTTALCDPNAPNTKCQTSWPNPWADWTGDIACATSETLKCKTVPVIAEWTDDPLCTAGYVKGVTTYCQNVIPPPVTSFVASVDKCQEGTFDGVITTCDTLTTGPTNVGVCTAADASEGNNWVTTKCPVVALGPTSDTLADVAEYYWKTDLRDPLQLPDRCTGGPVVSGNVTTYNDVCVNDAKNPRQFMNTYTLGLGASGLMQYQADYLTASSGDFNSLNLGVTADPATGLCPWQKFGECNWPKPESDSQTNIDDLWHAAVNGRGTYFSASDPASLATGISGALSNVGVKAGALAAVTVTSPNLVAGNENSVFEVSFKAGEWSGDVVKRTIDASTGELSEPVWAAQALLDAKVSGGTHMARTIYTYDSTTVPPTTKLKPFLWGNLSAAEKAYFELPAIKTLSQFCEIGTICLTADTQANADEEPLLDFVRGDKTNEGPLVNLGSYYRQRAHLLGDIAGSEAVYVRGSPWNYADLQYGAFKTANNSRAARVYVAANDGMLHALDAATGEEAWAYVPRIVMPSLYKLADKNYAAPTRHQFLVDGTPVAGDICVSDCASSSAVWKTILVGGLNHGGRGYYALDVTDPAAPKGLWEFTDDNLGYTYGNPVITKLKDGTWVVIVTSGYNNITPGDGEGRLFILNAASGAVIRTISTGVGDTTTPSGLARIAGWANFPDNNNTTQRVYGGDQLGNLWRFDINGDVPVTVDPPVYDAQRLAHLVDASGVAQPITSKPELGKVGSHSVVFIGTGQLLGSDDLVTAQQQSLYAIKDRLTGTDDYGSPRPLVPVQVDPVPGSFVAQTLIAGVCPAGNAYCTEGDPIVKVSEQKPVDFDTNDGWYIDFPVLGERVNTDLRLQLGTLAFNTNTPTTGACVPVGVSFAYFLDYRTGGAVEGTDGLIGSKLGDYLSTAPSVIRLEDGTIKELIRTDSPDTITAPVPTAPTPLDTRRVSWRELVTE
ncbi:PilC/PilY family type IV pilus protein [Candidatus Accumulibacter sp. ACC003]|uniref:pilus assembly protein n=1 Tax=Candidatus Accumulibacter sp. ACC003 TaxID=2823334 RepID=UPI0025C57506|nr:PilC/PilY family type IV pilus protein [Candidatus Accumulibacter sp. ACC003]